MSMANPFPKLTSADEDYLKALYDLAPAGQPISTNAVADRLQVRPSSATQMLQKLAGFAPPLVAYSKRRGVMLSEEGRAAALAILRRHRLLEAFLVNIMGYTWDEVHSEADHLEHVISSLFEERMAALLGSPDFDPHGDPIPNASLVLPGRDVTPLSLLNQGQRGIIRRVRARQPEVLRRLSDLGLRPGVQIEVVERSELDGVMYLHLEGAQQPLALGAAFTEAIDIEYEFFFPPLHK